MRGCRVRGMETSPHAARLAAAYKPLQLGSVQRVGGAAPLEGAWGLSTSRLAGSGAASA